LAKKDPKSSILFLPMNALVELKNEESLLELALNHDIDIAHSCGGMGTCGTCRVMIESPIDRLHARNEIEQDMANDRNFQPEMRLACQLTPTSGLIARVCLVLENLDSEEDQ
jgi:2Fe-2S ferredoxin